MILLFAAWPIFPSLMGCHIMLNLSHRLREREKERGYIKGPHYIGDDSGAWTCVLEDINSEMQKGFRFFFLPFKLDSTRTKDSFISSAVRTSYLQVKCKVCGLIRTFMLTMQMLLRQFKSLVHRILEWIFTFTRGWFFITLVNLWSLLEGYQQVEMTQ